MSLKEQLYWYCVTCGSVLRVTGVTESPDYLLPCLNCQGTKVALPAEDIKGKSVHCATCGCLLHTGEAIIKHMGQGND